MSEIETVVSAEETKEDASTPEPEWTANNLFEDMEADAGVRQVFASICPKVYQMFENPSKSQGDYTALINSLSNLVEQHLKSKSMKKLIQEDKKERFFAYFLHTLIDTEIVQGPILNKLYEQGTSDIATIRMAGKIQWHLENIDTLVAKLSMEDDAAETL